MDMSQHSGRKASIRPPGIGGEPPPQLAVIGAGDAGAALKCMAREVGGLAAGKGWTLVCGGLGGVMEAASEGAAAAGGLVVGLLPGESKESGNPYLTVSLPTGMGHGRNVLVAAAADVVIAVGGGFGTLSEMALALKMGKPVISLQSWRPHETVAVAESADEAMDLALRCLGKAGRG